MQIADDAKSGNNIQAAGNAPEVIKEKKGGNNMEKTVKIEGMMCGHCEMAVKKTLEALDFVESAQVSHEKGEAVITLNADLDEAKVKEAIEGRDYKFLGIE